jgi:hypothetical protein
VPSDIGLEPAFKNKRDQESDDDSVTASVDSVGKPRDDKKSKIILSSFMCPETTQSYSLLKSATRDSKILPL